MTKSKAKIPVENYRKTPYTYDPSSHVVTEDHDGKGSITVTDDSYTIREILEKHTRGVTPPIMREVYYDDDPENADTRLQKPDFDLTDIDDIKEEQVQLQEKLDKAKEQKQKSEDVRRQADTDLNEKSEGKNDSTATNEKTEEKKSSNPK